MPVGRRSFPDLKKGEEVKILVHAVNTDEEPEFGKVFRYSELYMVDLTSGVISKIGEGGPLYDDDGLGSVVAAGPVIYVLGCLIPDGYDGLEDYYNDPENEFTDEDRRKAGIGFVVSHEGKQGHVHRKASCLDLSYDKCWKAAPQPKTLDCSPVCASFGRNIFCFGGNGCFAEVFDPCKNFGKGKWDALPPPHQLGGFNHKHMLTVSDPVLTDPSHNRILVHFKDLASLYAYNPDAKAECMKWECLIPHGELRVWRKLAALVDGVLYFYVPDSPKHPFNAIHLAARKRLDVVFSCQFEDHDNTMSYEYQSLVNLGGGTLCLAVSSPDNKLSKTRLILTKFRVVHTDTKAIVTPISVKELNIDATCEATHFLPIQKTKAGISEAGISEI